MKLLFPENFYWGAATSAHQVEGNNHNDWTEWEKSEGRIAELKRRGEDIDNYISGRTCDHYNRYEEDFDIAKSLGHNAHRFSIEWSRIEPEEGKFDEKEIEHYRNVIKALRVRGIEPFVTLWHWTLPLWIRDIGGWENKKTIEYFVRYVTYLMRSPGIGDSVKFWMPINEPSIYTGFSYVSGIFPPQIKSYFRANRVLKNLIKAHKKSYKLIHEKSGKKVLVGVAHNFHYHIPYRKNNPLDLLATKIYHYICDIRSSKWASGYQDFIGLNYYHRDTVKFVFKINPPKPFIEIKNPNQEISDMGWDICPKGIYHILKELKRYKLPIYITENGIADAKDEKREKFIKEHLRWVHRAIQEGVDVRGYLYWSLLDNFEWDKGFWPRFGLVEVDYKTLERKIRPSAYEYAKIVHSRQFNK